jgi:hypothetical protein
MLYACLRRFMKRLLCFHAQMHNAQQVYGMHYNHQQSQQQQYPGAVHRMPMTAASVGPGPGHAVGPGQQVQVMAPGVTAGMGAPGGPTVQADDQTGVTMAGGVGGGPLKGLGGANKGPGGGNGVFMGHQQRSAPYPNPQQYMQSKRAQFVNGQTPSEVYDVVCFLNVF